MVLLLPGEGRGQRRDEAAPEVAVEALALDLDPVWPADLGSKAACFGQCLQSGMPAVQPFAVGVSLRDDRAGVIEQRFLGHTAEVGESFAQACQPGLSVFARG